MRETMKGFKKLISLNEALEILLRETPIKEPEVEEVDLVEAVGRIVARDIYAQYDIPPFDRSAVDGYAVRSSETISASLTNPIELKLIGRVTAGDELSKLPKLGRGEAIKIFTGAPIPPGADAVVMSEYVIEEGDKILVTRPVAPLQNISRRGEDFRSGELIVSRGTRLRPWHIGALAAQNITRVPVYRRIKVGVLSTGDEVIEPGDPSYSPESGKILDSTKPLLRALIRETGCEDVDFGVVKDDPRLIRDKILEALDVVDILITTGGSSIGETDLVPEAISMIEGSKILFHGVRIRPGKPVGLALVKNKPIFILSGFPVSALVEFQALIEPYINRIYHTKPVPKPYVRGVVTRRIANPPSTKSFVRVKVFQERDGKIYVEPLAITGSGVLSTLVKGNAILVIDEDLEGYDEGDEVEVELLENISSVV
ncbi:MAG: gephyrin-like molybdotransferase Glp [Sulfolobales archaeon]